jgi:hypothetical protein
MSLWKRKKRVSRRGSSGADTGRVQKAEKSAKRSPAVAMEFKTLTVEALESGLLPFSPRSPRTPTIPTTPDTYTDTWPCSAHSLVCLADHGS